MISLSSVFNWELGFLKWKGGQIKKFLKITLKVEGASIDFELKSNCLPKR